MFNLCLIADYCMFEFFNPQCQPGEVIIMQEAKYGRMNVGKCIDSDRELGCYADVLNVFDNLCSLKQTCNVQVGSNNIGSTSTCWKELAQYLEASYVCRKGLLYLPNRCGNKHSITLLTKKIYHIVVMLQFSI